MSPFWILLELRTIEVVVTTGARRRAKLQSNRHHQQINTQLLQAGCPSCRPTNSVKALTEKSSTFHGLPHPKLTWGLPANGKHGYTKTQNSNGSTIPRTKLAMAAVRTLLVASKKPWVTLNLPSGTQPRTIANSAARSPTTSACACTLRHKHTCQHHALLNLDGLAVPTSKQQLYWKQA